LNRPYRTDGQAAATVALLQLGVVGMSLNEGVLVLARNVIGFTGLGLLCSLVTGGLLAQTLPPGIWRSASTRCLRSGRRRGPGRAAPGDRGAWICACLCRAAGLLLFTIRGPRIGPSDDDA
jgi:hypothetical protein